MDTVWYSGSLLFYTCQFRVTWDLLGCWQDRRSEAWLQGIFFRFWPACSKSGSGEWISFSKKVIITRGTQKLCYPCSPVFTSPSSQSPSSYSTIKIIKPQGRWAGVLPEGWCLEVPLGEDRILGSWQPEFSVWNIAAPQLLWVGLYPHSEGRFLQ